MIEQEKEKEVVTSGKKVEIDKETFSGEGKIEQPSGTEVEKILSDKGFSNIKFLGGGWSSEAFNAEFEGRDCIIRVPKIGGGGFETYVREHAVLEFIADKIKSVRIPKTKICEDDDLVYVVHEKINGNAFNSKNFENLSETEQENFSKSVAKFFAELHAIDVSGLSEIKGIRWGDISTAFIKASFDNYAKVVQNSGWGSDFEFSKQEIDKFCNVVDAIVNLDEPEVLLHRDFYHKNFVVDDEMRLAGVFDFGNSSLADRAIEFKTFIQRLDDGTFIQSPMLKKILSHYNQISGASITFDDIVNQLKVADAYLITWLVSSDEVINNNKDNLRDCVTKIKQWVNRE